MTVGFETANWCRLCWISSTFCRGSLKCGQVFWKEEKILAFI